MENNTMENNATPFRPPDVGLRLAMMLLDHLIFSMAIGLLIVPFWFYYLFHQLSQLQQGQFPAGFFQDLWMLGVVYAFAAAVYLNKDALDGRSPGKRIIKAQVIHLQSGQAAGPLRCFVRNLTLPLWPVEGLLVLLNQDRRRLGDYLAGTQVVMLEADTAPGTIRWGQVLLSYALGVLTVGAVVLPLLLLFQRMGEVLPRFIPPQVNTRPNARFPRSINPLEERNRELDPVVREAIGEGAVLQRMRLFERGAPAAPYWYADLDVEADEESLLDDEAAGEAMANRIRTALEEHAGGLPVQGRVRLWYGSRLQTIPL